ncbi:hypothetical protein K2F40_16495 [Clostridium sp. CM028]|nr:hypothetical protein [Clostridium sp. CM028]MBW9150536.1 hypothetical protein [Clostridium sp. CM028]WLC62535.1 hypothetical protein KTC94_04450 [Clostridium sp. CM028]
MSKNVELIKNLCDNWKSEVLGENGSISIGSKSEKYRLINNRIQVGFK